MNKIICYLMYFLIILLATKAFAYTEKDCIRCHAHKIESPGKYLDIDAYRQTVHGNAITCLECHNNIKDENHITNKNTKKVDCKVCHDQPSLHAKDGNVTCINCHPPHVIYKPNDNRSSVNQRNLKKTCGKCHLKETRNLSFWDSLRHFRIVSHPKQNFSKPYDISNCKGCHQGSGAHGETKPTNKQDCYKCHMPLAKENIILGYMHPKITSLKSQNTSTIKYLLIAIMALLITFLIGNILRGLKK